MEIRLATLQDCDQVLVIIEEAKKYFKSQGIDQWQNGYPHAQSILQDVTNHCCYVLCDADQIIATAAILFEDDPNYATIEDGDWLSHSPYGVIHRIACLPQYKGQGLCSLFFEYAKMRGRAAHLHSLRVDTHRDNHSMQRLIAKNGFQYCGIVHMADGGERYAYEYVFEKERQNGF